MPEYRGLDSVIFLLRVNYLRTRKIVLIRKAGGIGKGLCGEGKSTVTVSNDLDSKF